MTTTVFKTKTKTPQAMVCGIVGNPSRVIHNSTHYNKLWDCGQPGRLSIIPRLPIGQNMKSRLMSKNRPP